ncbi:hypothetical protein N0V82_003901 [Gnomoniopsis sp. IMI 355080]|nr:hypothetical protein N0V82_003901 [Gnomoniopsis sp. IMI 355080]
MASPHQLPAGLSPDSIDVVSEAATIFARVQYAPSADTPDSANKIAPRDLPAATDPLKHKLQNARAALHTLPDITRTIPEQEAEIKLVQAKIERQRAALQKLKEFGLKFAAESAATGDGDVEMSGTTAGGAEGAQGGTTANIRGSDRSAMVSVGHAVQSSEQGINEIKPPSKRKVHFVLDDSQTPVADSATVRRDSVGSNSAVQGYGVNNKNGQLLASPSPDSGGSVSPMQQTTPDLATVFMVDGANESEDSVTMLTTPELEIEANTSAENTGDVVTVTKASGFDNSQALVNTDDDDDQGPITELSQSAKANGKDVALMESPEALVSGPAADVITEHGRSHDAAIMAEVSGTATSSLSPDMSEDDSPTVSTCDIHDTCENIKVPDGTVDESSFHNAALEDMNHQSTHEQQYTDFTPGGSRERPVEDIDEQSPLKRLHDDVAPFIKSPTWPVEDANDQPPAKRQRIDAASQSNTEQSAHHNGEQFGDAASQRETRLASDGDGSKPELERSHPPAVAPAPVPTSTDWSKLTVVNLRKELSKRGLPIKGVKTLLVQRLREFDMTQALNKPAEEEGDGGPAFAEPEFEGMVKGDGVGQASEALADTINSPENDVSATARNGYRDQDVENLEGLVDDVIFADDVGPANVYHAQAMEKNYINHPHECSDSATAGSFAEGMMQDDLQWQDDTYEEVVLLTTPDPNSPRAECSVRCDGDADISLDSVEAPAIEPGMDNGTPPRFTGSGTMWTRATPAR